MSIAFAILVGPMPAQEPEQPRAPEQPEEEFVPFPLEHRLSRGERDAPAVFVRLREGGVVQVRTGEVWKETTLDELGTILSSTRDEDCRAQEKLGKSGLEEGPDGCKATRLFLSLEADAAGPWQQVHWVMTVAMEQKYRKLELWEGKRRLLYFLPVDRSVCGSWDEKPPPEVRAEVHVVARAEQPARWGEAGILRPTEFRYRCGDLEIQDLADVRACLRRTKKTVEDRDDQRVVFYGLIKAGNKVPYARVFDVMEAFVAADIACVALYGVAIPPKDVRAAKRLPYPKKNYGAAGD